MALARTWIYLTLEMALLTFTTNIHGHNSINFSTSSIQFSPAVPRLFSSLSVRYFAVRLCLAVRRTSITVTLIWWAPRNVSLQSEICSQLIRLFDWWLLSLWCDTSSIFHSIIIPNLCWIIPYVCIGTVSVNGARRMGDIAFQFILTSSFGFRQFLITKFLQPHILRA